ncbi:MAG: hypothetical protein AAF222_09490 [Pseudomonadota bacterium]
MIEQTGEAMRTGDFDLFMRHFAVPFVMETYEGTHLLSSRHEMKLHFDGVRRFRADNDIVASRRENISAEYYNTDTISLIHVSHLFQEGDVLFDRPYPTYSVIRKVGGTWLTHYCQYAVGDLDAFTRALMRYKEDDRPNETAITHS